MTRLVSWARLGVTVTGTAIRLRFVNWRLIWLQRNIVDAQRFTLHLHRNYRWERRLTWNILDDFFSYNFNWKCQKSVFEFRAVKSVSLCKKPNHLVDFPFNLYLHHRSWNRLILRCQYLNDGEEFLFIFALSFKSLQILEFRCGKDVQGAWDVT